MNFSRNNTLGINELISKIKQDLLHQSNNNELFFVEEINLEISFVISGDIDSGFNLGVVTLGSDISEERTQKVNIKLTPILSKDKVLEGLSKERSKIIDSSSKQSLIKGSKRDK